MIHQTRGVRVVETRATSIAARPQEVIEHDTINLYTSHSRLRSQTRNFCMLSFASCLDGVTLHCIMVMSGHICSLRRWAATSFLVAFVMSFGVSALAAPHASAVPTTPTVADATSAETAPLVSLVCGAAPPGENAQTAFMDCANKVVQTYKSCSQTGGSATSNAQDTAENSTTCILRTYSTQNNAAVLTAVEQGRAAWQQITTQIALATTQADCVRDSDGNSIPDGVWDATVKPPVCKPNPANSSVSAGAGATTNACGISGPLAWIACPLTGGLAEFAKFLANRVGDLLYVSPETTFNPAFREAWGSFRNLGMALIVIAGLFMVISQALGLEILDAYTIRKLMPRLGVALIGIVISWPLLVQLVVLFNDLGIWAHDLILQPFDQARIGWTAFNISSVSGAVGSVTQLMISRALEGLIFAGGVTGLAVGAGFLGWAGILAMAATIVLALLIGLLVLATRQIIIMAAILMAPLAIACYVLPGTQKVWAFWKNTVLTTLMMFPIIMGFITIGEALSRLVAETTAPGSPWVFFAILVLFAPYFMLPFAFKMAGGLMSTIFSIANDRSRGVFDRLRKVRSDSMQRRWGEYAHGTRGNENSILGKIAGYGTALKDPGVGISGLRTKEGREAARGKLREHGINEAIRNNALAWTADDAALGALSRRDTTRANYAQHYIEEARRLGSTESDERLRAQAAESLATIETGLGTKLGSTAMRVGTWKAKQLSKTGYGDEESELQRRILDSRHMVDEGLVTAYEAAGILKQSQRVEVSQASYSDLIKLIQGNDGNGKGTDSQISDFEISSRLLDSTAEYITPGALIGMRKEAMRVLARHLGERTQVAFRAATADGATEDQKREFATFLATFSGIRDTINSHARHLAGDFAAGYAGVELGDVELEVQEVERDSTGNIVMDNNGRPKVTVKKQKQSLSVRQYEDALKQGLLVGQNKEDIIRFFLDQRREWSTSDIASNGGMPPGAAAALNPQPQPPGGAGPTTGGSPMSP